MLSPSFRWPGLFLSLMSTNKKKCVFDVECYPNWFCVNFECLTTGRRRSFELYEGHPLDRINVFRIIRSFCLIGFNSGEYDLQMLRLAMRAGVTNTLLKTLNDAIIIRGLKPWDAEREFNLPDIQFDHIDLIEPAPSVQVGLKLYMGRLHSRKIQDLPYHPSDILTREQQLLTSEYCFNDLEGTKDLYNHIAPQLELREQLGKEYGLDLRSKSDAQCAEAIIKVELERLKGERIFRPELPSDYSFKYTPPEFIQFRTPQMQEVLQTVKDATFKLNHKRVRDEDSDENTTTVGGVKVKVSGIAMPQEIKGLRINIGQSTYKMGIGGLHSQEKHVCHYASKFKYSKSEGKTHYEADGTVLRDADVAAFYPMLILVCELYPEHLGPDFLRVYRSLRERRMSAKERSKKAKKLIEMGVSAMQEAQLRGDMASCKVIDMTLKIVLNGTFGKLGSKWSFLYSPNLMIQVTMTGQLVLLMLIERLEAAGISVISANTDGIVSKMKGHQQDIYHTIIREWEEETGFEMEFADYKSLHSASVNSYIAIKTDGEVKQKGAYAFVGSKGSPAEKNPFNYICIDAVVNYLAKGTPLEDTIEWCPDIRRFLTVRRVTGGAEYQGNYLGKVVRWYHGVGRTDTINYAVGEKRGHKVAKSDGAVPMMELTGLPCDIDYDHYLHQSRRMLGELGVL